MNLRAPVHHLRLFLATIILALGGAAALAQVDPPGRVGRINHAEGTVTFAPAGDDEWTDAPRNRPLTRGDRLYTDRGARAEVQVGSATLRLDGMSRLEILELDDHSAKLSLTQGSVNVRVRSLPDGENFEIDTPNLAYRAAFPGDYRVDVDPGLRTTRVTIHSGTGAVYGEGGQAQSLGAGQQLTFSGRTLAPLEARESPPQDGFDRWSADRNRREDQSIAARHVPREVVGYQELDPHGQWVRDPTHGVAWIPQGTPANWAPYRNGRWEWISPWGWSWIDDAPWGFAPFHYGRWTLLADRWAWVPGRLSLRPVYAPALVAFVGGARGILPGSSASEVAWFPLAPGEMWQPGFRASMAYVSNVNHSMVPGQHNASYAHQRRREALTAISRDDFHRGRPVAASWLRVAAITLTNAAVVPPPPQPERTAVAARERAPSARSAPPPASSVQQVTALAAVAPAASAPRPATTVGSGEPNRATAPVATAAARPPAASVAAPPPATPPVVARAAAAGPKVAPPGEQAQARQQADQQARVEQARRAEATAAAAAATARAQASAAATARQAAIGRADAARREQQQQAQRAQALKREQALAQAAQQRRDQAQRAEAAKRQHVARAQQPKREQAVARAEQARRERIASRVDEHKRAQLAQREQLTRREQQARQGEASRREALARRDERLRLATQARRDEQLRREARAAQVEQARRAADREAVALRQQRLQRDEQAQRAAQEREQVQRASSQRDQQAVGEQWRRDQQAWEQQQRQRARPRPDLRPDWRDDARDRPPEVWQRGVPILNPGRTS